MMRKALIAMTLGAMLAPLGLAQAQVRLEAGVTAGTLGVGPELNLRTSDLPFGLRLNGTYMNVTTRGRISGAEYRGAFNMVGGGAIADFYPLDTGLRLSGGVRYGAPRWRMHAAPAANGTVRVGDATYASSQVGNLSGTDKFNTVLPYVGVGYSASLLNDRLVLAADVGVAYQGNGRLSLSASGPLSNDANFRANLAREQSKVRNYANIPVYPVVMVSLRYNFFSMAAHEPPPPPVRVAVEAAPPPMAAPPVVRTYVVYFDLNSASLNARARDVVNEAANSIRTTGLTRIEVVGHTDSLGSPASNQRLSVRRAEAVAAQLTRLGVPRNQMAVSGMGETSPAVPSADSARVPQNRRVEVVAR